MNRTVTYNPDTHAVVPKEATHEMALAGADVVAGRNRSQATRYAMKAAYAAMLAAAPVAPEVGQQDDRQAMTHAEMLAVLDPWPCSKQATTPVVQQGCPELSRAFITLESGGGAGRSIVLKFNQQDDAHAVHDFLLKGAIPAPAVATLYVQATPAMGDICCVSLGAAVDELPPGEYELVIARNKSA